jgi:hypothetical protein
VLVAHARDLPPLAVSSAHVASLARLAVRRRLLRVARGRDHDHHADRRERGRHERGHRGERRREQFGREPDRRRRMDLSDEPAVVYTAPPNVCANQNRPDAFLSPTRFIDARHF